MRLPLALVAMFALTACVPSRVDWPEVYKQSQAYNAEVNALSDTVSAYAPAVVIVCNLRGTRSDECAFMSSAYNAARHAVIGAHAAVEVYKQAGHGAQAVDGLIAELRKAVSALAAQGVDDASMATEVARVPDPEGGGRGGGPSQPADAADAGAADAAEARSQ